MTLPSHIARVEYAQDNRSLLRKALHSLIDNLGPRSLQYLLEANSGMHLEYPFRHDCIDYDAQLPWHRLSDESPYSGLHPRMIQRTHGDYHPRISDAPISTLSTLVQKNKIEACSYSIKSIFGLSASRSPLKEFQSLDAFAQTHCAHFIESMHRDGIDVHLSALEGRVINRPGSYTFAMNAWDHRLYVLNEDGSHRLSAAHHVAHHTGTDYLLRGALLVYRLDTLSVHQMRADFHAVVVSDGSMGLLRELIAVGYGVNFHELPLPTLRLPDFDKQDVAKPCAILLPKGNRQADMLAKTFFESGFTDLNQILGNMLSQQNELDSTLTRFGPITPQYTSEPRNLSSSEPAYN